MKWRLGHALYDDKYIHAKEFVGLLKQGVALTGRNTTGPPRAALW